MTSDAFRVHQRTGLVSYVGALAQTCIRRFRDSALLVGADLEQWPMMKNAYSERIDLVRLAPFWTKVCDRYNREIYEPQLSLSLPSKELLRLKEEKVREEDVFSRFIHWRLWPIIASENECVRNVLRAVGFLPSQSPLCAADALAYFVEEMSFHASMYRPDPGYFE